MCERIRERIERVLTDKELQEEAKGLVIHLGEMLSFVAFTCAMGERWANKVIVYAGDNMVVKNWIQSRKSGIRGGRLLVRVLNMIEMRWGCRILAGWWRTYHNVDADYITRCSDQEFVEFVKAKGFHVIDVKMAVQEALVDSESFGPCFLYGTDQEDRSVLLQLKERRLKRQVQKSLPIRWDRIRVVEWSCHGRSVKDFEATAGHLALGVDSQGRQLCKVVDTAKTAGATLCIIEGPRGVAWELAEEKCDQKQWGHGIIEFVTTELGEAAARRRRCLRRCITI